MQLSHWFLLATTAILATAKPTDQSIDISALPECWQQCMLLKNKYFDIETAKKKKMCKDTMRSHIWLEEEVFPCMERDCAFPTEGQDPETSSENDEQSRQSADED